MDGGAARLTILLSVNGQCNVPTKNRDICYPSVWLQVAGHVRVKRIRNDVCWSAEVVRAFFPRGTHDGGRVRVDILQTLVWMTWSALMMSS